MPKKPKLHKKPTPQELQDEMDKAIEELEQDESPKNTEETPPKKVTKKKTKKVDGKEEVEEVKKEPDYKKKFAESTREAQVLSSKNKKINEAIAKAGDVVDPTDKELLKEFPEWEEMSDFERKIAKDGFVNKKRFEAITESTKGFKDIDKWTKKVDGFMDDPITLTNYPGLEGKEESFKLFSTKPTRRGVDFEDLVSAFLYEEDSKPKVGKGQMFETGSGGLNEKPQQKVDKITLDESIKLRNNNYKKYLQYVREGKIDLDSI